MPGLTPILEAMPPRSMVFTINGFFPTANAMPRGCEAKLMILSMSPRRLYLSIDSEKPICNDAGPGLSLRGLSVSRVIKVGVKEVSLGGPIWLPLDSLFRSSADDTVVLGAKPGDPGAKPDGLVPVPGDPGAKPGGLTASRLVCEFASHTDTTAAPPLLDRTVSEEAGREPASFDHVRSM